MEKSIAADQGQFWGRFERIDFEPILVLFSTLRTCYFALSGSVLGVNWCILAKIEMLSGLVVWNHIPLLAGWTTKTWEVSPHGPVLNENGPDTAKSNTL